MSMADDANPRKDAPEDDLDSEILELEQKLKEVADGKPLTKEDDRRVAELADKLESEGRLEAFLAGHDQRLEELISIAQDLRVEQPEEGLDPDLDAKLRAIEEKAKEARSRKSTGLTSEERQREIKSDREAARGLGVGLSVAYTIIGVPMVGLAIGWFLDKQTDSNVFKAAFVVGGATLGIIMTVVILNREQNKK